MNQIDQIKEDIRIYAKEGFSFGYVMASLYEQLEELRPYVELAELVVQKRIILEAIDEIEYTDSNYRERPEWIAKVNDFNVAHFRIDDLIIELKDKIKEQGDD